MRQNFRLNKISLWCGKKFAVTLSKLEFTACLRQNICFLPYLMLMHLAPLFLINL